MNRISGLIATIIIAGLIGGVVFSADPVRSQNQTAGKLVAAAEFINVDPSDTLHWGKGGLQIRDGRVELNQAFEVPPGPKYHVYILFNKEVKTSDDVALGELVDLGRLRHFKGAQVYDIPRGLDISQFGSIIIYCEGFSTLISPASLKFVQN